MTKAQIQARLRVILSYVGWGWEEDSNVDFIEFRKERCSNEDDDVTGWRVGNGIIVTPWLTTPRSPVPDHPLDALDAIELHYGIATPLELLAQYGSSSADEEVSPSREDG